MVRFSHFKLVKDSELRKQKESIIENSIHVLIDGKPALVSVEDNHQGKVRCPVCNGFMRYPPTDFDKIKAVIECMKPETFENKGMLHCKTCNKMYTYEIKITEGITKR